MTSIRKAKKQMKKARPYWESQGYRFGRKAKILFFPRGYYLWYSFVDMDGRIQKLSYSDKVKKKQKKQSLVPCFFLVFTFSFLGYSLSEPRAFVAS